MNRTAGQVDAYFRVSAVLGLLAVALGAFGAHAMKETLTANGMTEIWKTASFYHLVHGGVLLFIAWQGISRWAWALMAAGVVVFSGSLYLLAVSGCKWLGAITPVGGVLLLAGWLLLALASNKS